MYQLSNLKQETYYLLLVAKLSSSLATTLRAILKKFSGCLATLLGTNRELIIQFVFVKICITSKSLLTYCNFSLPGSLFSWQTSCLRVSSCCFGLSPEFIFFLYCSCCSSFSATSLPLFSKSFVVLDIFHLLHTHGLQNHFFIFELEGICIFSPTELNSPII